LSPIRPAVRHAILVNGVFFIRNTALAKTAFLGEAIRRPASLFRYGIG
jgi:hypothetical protein